MDPDTDTFLVTVYAHTDDIYKERFAHLKPVRPGAKPKVSDSEVLTLAILAQHHPRRSESAFLRFVKRNWKGYFPVVLGQSSFNRRMRDLWGVLAAMGPEIAKRVGKKLGKPPAYEVVDGTGVPLVKLCRSRTRLFGDGASKGKGGSDKSWYYGIKLFCVVDQHGAISGFAACRADTEERWFAESTLRWRHNPWAAQPSSEEMADVLGPPHNKGQERVGPQAAIWPRAGAGTDTGCDWAADLGYTGEEWQQHWQEEYGAFVLTAEGLSPKAARSLSSMRQQVERVFAALFEHFGLAYPKARSLWGVMARISAKIAAFDMAVCINCLSGRPTHSILDPIA